MTNLKLIISTRTQEEFDRVLLWAETKNIRWQNGGLGNDNSILFDVYKEDTILFIEKDISYSVKDFYERNKNDEFVGYTFLSFPEFEKQYLTNGNNVHKV